jgi:hypothetical protein
MRCSQVVLKTQYKLKIYRFPQKGHFGNYLRAQNKTRHNDSMNGNLLNLLESVVGTVRAKRLMDLLRLPSVFHNTPARMTFSNIVTRAELAQAMNMILFDDLLERVPTGRAYARDVKERGERIHFDHGALRTVQCRNMGTLPNGEAAFIRFLEPLGYRLNGVYPLDRLKMIGRSYVNVEAPEEIAQYFVSELDVSRFSPDFQRAAENVLRTSRDPLTPTDVAQLMELDRDAALPFDDAAALLPALVGCFARHHHIPALADYETLLAESDEMAWIATEGNAFNHATDRVTNVDHLAAAQRTLGRPIKDKVEVSASGRVRQTAFRADRVKRQFVDKSGALVEREVPGSFYEFITRDRYMDPASNRMVLDLGFDSGNAQGIFKMTAAQS